MAMFEAEGERTRMIRAATVERPQALRLEPARERIVFTGQRFAGRLVERLVTELQLQACRKNVTPPARPRGMMVTL